MSDQILIVMTNCTIVMTNNTSQVHVVPTDCYYEGYINPCTYLASKFE